MLSYTSYLDRSVILPTRLVDFIASEVNAIVGGDSRNFAKHGLNGIKRYIFALSVRYWREG